MNAPLVLMFVLVAVATYAVGLAGGIFAAIGWLVALVVTSNLAVNAQR